MTWILPLSTTSFRRYDWSSYFVLRFSSSILCNVFVVFWIAPLGPIYLGGTDVRAGLRGFRCYGWTLLPRKLVVTFHRLHCLCELSCCYPCGSTSLLSLFGIPMLRPDLYSILWRLVFVDVTINFFVCANIMVGLRDHIDFCADVTIWIMFM